MVSEIQLEIREYRKKMEELISKRKFTVRDANVFLKRVYNYERKIEDLETSRNNYKGKYWDLRDKIKDLKKRLGIK